MAKNKKSAESYTVPEMGPDEVNPETGETSIEVKPEEVKPEEIKPEEINIETILDTDTDELKAIKGAIATIRANIATINVSLKAEKKLLNENLGNLRSIVKGEPVKTGKKYLFTPVVIGDSETIKMGNGKPLSYQGKMIVKIFNETIAEPTAFTRDEILERLEKAGYPCVGNMFDNFSWYKTQVLKPLKLVD
jgi:hypothetical protein